MMSAHIFAADISASLSCPHTLGKGWKLMEEHYNDDTKVNEIISDMLLKFHNEVVRMSRKPNNYGTAYPVYQSEIHMLDFIGRHPDRNISELAEEVGMSKSAVSQIISKLHAKNFIAKERYKKEVTVRLTEKGNELFKGHQEYHKTLNQYSVFKNTEKYPTATKALIAEFLAEYISDLPKY